MEAKTKQRVIGGLVLVAVVAIFLPLLFHHSHPSMNLALSTDVPDAPPQPQVQLQLPPDPHVDSSGEQVVANTHGNAADSDAATITTAQNVQTAAEKTPKVMQKILNTQPAPAAAAQPVANSPETAAIPALADSSAAASAATSAASDANASSADANAPAGASAATPDANTPSAASAAAPDANAPSAGSATATPGANTPNGSAAPAAATSPVSTPDASAAPASATAAPAPAARPDHAAKPAASTSAPSVAPHPAAEPLAANPPTVKRSKSVKNMASSASVILQVASFANPDNATRLVQQLRAKGIDAHVNKKSAGISRVYVGPLSNRAMALELQQKLKQQWHLVSVIKNT